ncbi:recombination mediator RecR [Leptospirillum ferriphilum]|jgi:recombination protein RecR|uniref:Recombination protein RecR n=2 Tax=Leptospirillum TaxID=179 RepID=A0A094WH09_9BACT|nr:recombination mediator RecR [Leptospirillum ferriphilum]EDZ39681.1 MAG: Recombination protein RecR [Leptospirillum sp. Group II '5-way CG']KGA94942.1 Recombination protein RecR [Leptospirillum ferriphilum]
MGSHASRDFPNKSPYPLPFHHLIESLRTLPGIGIKTATRLAFHLLKAPEEEALQLSREISGLREALVLCPQCQNIMDRDSRLSCCTICADPARDPGTVMVVEDIQTLYSIERTGEFRGRYHVLLGRLSPLEGIGPEALRVRELLDRTGTGEIHEMILATSPTVEGESTALYLARLFKPLGVKVSRIAFGIPVGLELEFVDDITLIRSVEARRPM